MKIWFTADLHLDHSAILKFTRRPFSNVEDMNTYLKEEWNKRVNGGDYVYIVGDFAFKRHNKWLSELKGKKILIRGNHDKMNKLCEAQFTEIHDCLCRRINGQWIFFFHYACRTWPGPWGETWSVYGHSHGRMLEYEDNSSCDVGIDVWNYAPISFEMLKEKMTNKKKVIGNPVDELNKRIDNLIIENKKIRENIEK